MEKKTHLGFLTGAVAVGVMLIAVIASYGHVIETEITLESAARADLAVGPQSGRVAGVTVDSTKLIIDRGNGNSLTMDVPFAAGMTAYDLVKQVTAVYGLPLDVQVYSFGTLVTKIGDLANGQDNKNWIYYVNGASATTSADTQALNPGDQIEFKFETSPF